MIKNAMNKFRLLVLGACLIGGPALASESAGLAPAHTNIGDTASLQNGAKLFFNYCSGCHSLRFMRYSRIAEDLGLSERQVMDNLVLGEAKFADTVHAAMAPADAERWFGKAPPDLSLEVRAKGADWVYNYLKSFYLDPSRPLGWNNTVFPNASMPNALWELQGVQTANFKPAAEAGGDPVFEGFDLHQPGRLSATEFDAAARDITTFLQYAAEPAALQREAIGVWVLLFLSLLTFLAWLLKQEYWKDVH